MILKNYKMTNLSMKEMVREMKECKARLVHKSEVNPRLTRSSLTVRKMDVTSLNTPSASLSTILERVLGCLTFTLLEITLMTF